MSNKYIILKHWNSFKNNWYHQDACLFLAKLLKTFTWENIEIHLEILKIQ